MCQKSFKQVKLSLGPVANIMDHKINNSNFMIHANILAIFSNANIANVLKKKNKRIKRCHIKGIGCPLLILIDIVIFDQETEK